MKSVSSVLQTLPNVASAEVVPLKADAGIYDDQGNKVELLRDMIKVTAVAKVQVDAPVGEFNINQLDINGTSLKHNGKDIGDTHKHGGVTIGTASSGVPV